MPTLCHAVTQALATLSPGTPLTADRGSGSALPGKLPPLPSNTPTEGQSPRHVLPASLPVTLLTISPNWSYLPVLKALLLIPSPVLVPVW